MESFNLPVILGRSGLEVSRLGISSSYGAPTAAFEEAFEKGCNYFVMGSFPGGRSKQMMKAVKTIVQKGHREKLVVCMMDYTHSYLIGKNLFYKGLKQLGLDYVDVLTMGRYSRKPRIRVLDLALELKENGLVRSLALAGHNRKLFPKLREEGLFDIFHVRYNAVNSGAEKDLFPFMGGEDRPGMVSYTATRWGKLLKEKKMPPDEKPLTAEDCYRFVLSNPAVDVCMTGARTLEMMRENLETLNSGPLSQDEMDRIRRIGDYIYGKSRE